MVRLVWCRYGSNQFRDPVGTANGTAGVDAAAAVAEAGGSKLFLEMLGADTYSFTLDTAAISFAYDGTSANRDTIAQSIETTLNALGGDTYSAVNANGRVEITNQSDSAMALSAFTSTGSGKIIASTVVKTLALRVCLKFWMTLCSCFSKHSCSRHAYSNRVDLSFTADDTYSFKISDGVRTAIVDATAVDVTGTDATGMLAAIEYGLEQAGMDTSITAAHAAGVITLTQAAGREISISDFRQMV